ncbi:type IV secretory system conjugative DNA transfer family protein [Nocardia huaxiensis]|uniref:type IV secretory system conjugative DNA transfer family protein n=1 Tax=Nocardia huaxiensis TaxID=2755382 RepID=UPI001E4FDDB9|nr:TraM recognition domain-containing protein [Nocardia huaxiensis]UFS97400.1 TraM recognition domain-containing protein [Nocardia huaxiensis]
MAKKPVKDPADPGPDTTLYLIYAGFAIFGTLWLAMQLGSLLSGQKIPINPIAIGLDLAKGKIVWPTAATVIVILVIIAALAWVILRRKSAARASVGRLPVDDKADYMGSGGAIKSLTAAGAREKAERIGMRLGKDDLPGVPIGMSVADGEMLYGSYEDLHVDIWGPRQGKTTSRVIPAILSAIGPAMVTSNKRDVVDATRLVREQRGSNTWVFDPQGVADEEPTWYWDPLAWVNPGRPGYDGRAASLAGHFADGSDGGTGGSDSDTYFTQEAEELLSALLLAAAVSRKPITQVWEWVTNPLDTEPIEILRNSMKYDIPSEFRDSYHFVASGLAQQYNADPRTVSGIFGTAKKMIRSLKLSSVQRWIQSSKRYTQEDVEAELARLIKAGSLENEQGAIKAKREKLEVWLGSQKPDGRRQFDELEFIEGNGTLYCLSLEGRSSAGPLVSAFIEAVIDVAVHKASRSPRGRLPIPLLAVLDEAANVVRWKDLPKHYSHFGSRGIVVMTVLQSWAQGARCWGVDGMEALWAAANVRVLGSGVDDVQFLQQRAETIGEYESISQSVSESKGGKSYSRSLGSSKTFNVNSLATLPTGRAIVFSSATPAVLIKTVPWWEGEYSTAVLQSLEKHEPGMKKKTEMIDLVNDRLSMTKKPVVDAGTIEEARPL